MSFKHTKFEDSPTMRSLEKVAVKHGLLTPETTVKTASARVEADYTPSANLMENVIKLCAGLREKGFEKHANELETRFIDYKRAFNAYETSTETGEDLVDAAHPDGSHDLKEVEGDATIETIVDQHLKNLNIVNKKPTGKLASTRDIISAVKIALADDKSNIMGQITSNTNRIVELFNSVLNHIKKEVNLDIRLGGALEATLQNPTVQNLNDAKQFIIYANNTIKQYVSEATWNEIVKSDIFAKIISFIQPTIDLRKKYDDLAATEGAQQLNPSIKPPVAAPVAPASKIDDLESQIKKSISTLNVWKSLVNLNEKAKPVGKKQALDWLDTKEARLQNLLKQYTQIDHNNRLEYADAFRNNYNSIVNEPGESFDEFKKVWIG